MNPNDLLPYIPGLRRYARTLSCDAWAADDLVQDTLERAYSKRLLWRVDTDLRAWLFTLMHNLHANEWRRRAAQRAAGHAVDLDDVQSELVAQPTSTETEIDLQRCLLQLPDDQRVTLLLVSLEDLSYEAVARITGVPVGTVMSRLSRARHRLQQLMNVNATTSPEQQKTHPPGLRRLK